MSSAETGLTYRPDIDGLRAVAVALVVLNHSNLGPFPGGYIGVDVFFVISGFLITGLIVGALNRGTFSFRDFYERRARRILPALLAVLTATTLSALLILPPEELRDFAASVPAVLLMGANLHMRSLGGYFGTDMDTVPLLHLWSVAVEEQFYLGFPVLLWAVHHWRPRLVAPIVLIALIALFILATVNAARGRPSTYYLLENRAWELLLGSFIWLYSPIFVRLLRPARTIATSIGLSCVIASAVMFDATSGIPGWPALLPTLGAALILAPGNTGAAARVLASMPLRVLGRLSYSLYLWHWPILVFAAVMAPKQSWALRIGLLAAMLVAATLSYRFVETPCRRPTPGRRPIRFVFGVGAVALPVFTLALISVSHPTWTGTVPLHVGEQLAQLRRDRERIRDCRVVSHAGNVTPCDLGTSSAETPLYVIGDSHAGALAIGLVEATGRSVRLDTVATCPPLPGMKIGTVLGAAASQSCRIRNTSLPMRLIDDPRIETVILVGAWAQYRDAISTAEAPTFATVADQIKILAEKLTASGKMVVIVGPAPPHSDDTGITYGRAAAGWPASLSTSRADLAPTYVEAARVFASFGANSQMSFVDPQAALCDADRCFVARDGAPLYYDRSHLSRYGAFRVGLLIDAALRRQAMQRPQSATR